MKFYEAAGLAERIAYITPEKICYPQFDENGKVKYNYDEKGKYKGVISKDIILADLSPDERRDAIKKALSYDIVISDNATLMQLAMDGELEAPPAGVNRHNLADEADFVTLDSYRPKQKTRELSDDDTKKREDLRKKAYSILHVFDKGPDDKTIQDNMYVFDDTNQYVDFTSEGKRKIIDYINKTFSDYIGIDKNQLFDFIYDALVVEIIYKENRDYQVLNLDEKGTGEVIVSEDRASGVAIDFPEGIKQALQIKLQKEGKYEG